jgi:membrane protease YdiL (CAAX protease family)
MFPSPRALLLFLLTVGPAAAIPPDPAGLLDGKQAFDALVSRQAADYRQLDEAFIEAQAKAPDDAALAVAHCDLFWHVWDIEGLAWADDAYRRHADCIEALEARFPDAPEVRILLAEQDSSAERDRSAMALWKHSEDWPASLRARLASALAGSDHIGDRAGDFAVEAVQLGNTSVLPQAIRHVAASDGPDAAARLAAGAPLATSRWQLDERLEALATVDHPTAAREHLARHHDAKVLASWPVAVDILVKAGDLAQLETMLREREGGEDEDQDELRAARLALAVARDDAGEALRHFEPRPFEFDAFAGDYFRILGMNPLLALAPSMLPFTLMLLLICAALMLMPLLVLVPVHYRGLARRVAGRAPAPLFPGLGLRHAWYGLGVCLLLMPILLLSVTVPQVMGELFSGNDAAGNTLTVALWSSLGALLALLPTVYWLRRPQWTVPRADALGMLWRVLLVYVIGFGIGLACMAVETALSSSGVSLQTSTTHTTMFEEGMARYGFVVTLLVIGLLVPIVEEWVFRGLLLGGLARHIHFGWANLLQASLFMVIHDDVMRFPFYLAIGLMAGWLVKRYRSLLPAILLHVINNAVATWLRAS